MAETTIQVSTELLAKLKVMKLHEKESYEDLLWDLIEDRLELSEETKKSIAQSRQEYNEGKYKTFEQVKEDLDP
ncbi:hypothetical protein FJZ18_01765 [Candidatus Pacearchaeota archaeon]|nr:hypothetical protein [Candidatus Pacearchaeota archaeon]